MPVFHLDIEAFMTAVERVKDRGLRSRPLVIAPAKARATVLAASPDAKSLGICREMPIAHVRKNFAGVHVIPPHYTLYDKANRYVLEMVHQYSPLVEPVGYGHIAMDMTGMTQLFGSLESAALKICREIQARACLSGTVGIAANKLVSTIAAKEVQKNREALYQVAEGDEPRFLAPLSCKALPEWGNPYIKKLLFELNLRRIEHIQAIPRDLLSFAAGSFGMNLHRHAHGIDTQPVTPPMQTRHLDEEHIFHPDTNDDAVIRAAVHALVEKLCFQLRAKGISADRARFTLKYTDDVWRTRPYVFSRTQQEQTIYQTLLRDYERLCDRRQRVRYLRISLAGLCDHHQQPSLFEQPKPKRVAPHLDLLRERFGAEAVRYGRTLKASTA